ncbi:MAG: S-methyl-5'-thioadenosine phosphorylase [Magnetococcus sp. THC-1_WYH]
MVKIGIIGGSGLDNPDIMKDARKLEVDTPYGKPSSALTTGTINGVDVAILARHGYGHTIPPSQVNFRANIAALSQHGCTHILATTAVGSLRLEIAPGHLVFPSQFIDWTKKRANTYFDGAGEVVHTAMSQPFCSSLRRLFAATAQDLGLAFHENKTVITIEGPRFSTQAESHMFRQWGADIINMSTVPECVLAREKKLHYAAVAMSTDYDCWHAEEEPVTWEMIQKTMHANADRVIRLFLALIPKMVEGDDECTL